MSKHNPLLRLISFYTSKAAGIAFSYADGAATR